MPRSATGVDVGTRTVKCLRGHAKGNSFVVTDFALARRAPGDGGGVLAGWQALEPGFKLGSVRVGVGGREVNVRYTRVPRVPDWQLRRLMRFEVEEVGGQSGAEVASDYNVLPELPELEDEDVVLLAMARESLLEEHLRGLAALGGTLDAFTPGAIALYNAWLRYGVLMDDTVLVANIGHETTDVVLARGPDLLFARNLSGGAALFDQAIAQRLGCSPEKAEEVKRRSATLEPRERYEDPVQEKASRACLAPAGQMLSLLQSAVLFCKSQIKLTSLKLDRVMLCGGGAELAGLERYLAGGLGCKVEAFDPFRVVDTSRLDAEAAALLEENAREAVVALGLATAASDPEAYSIELLPAALRRRRDLLQGKLFTVAAGVLAAGFLVYQGWRQHDQLSGLRTEVSQLDRRLQAARAADNRTRALIAENEELRDHAERLYEMAGAGRQLGDALRALQSSLPSDFWLKRLSNSVRFDPELGIERSEPRPILHLEGEAREGTEAANVLFQRLVEGLRRELPGVAAKHSLSPTGASFSIDLSLLAPRPPPEAPGAESIGASSSDPASDERPAGAGPAGAAGPAGTREAR